MLAGPVFEKPMDMFFLVQIYGDARRYSQIILNFLSNGIKFTLSGGSVTVLLKVTEVCDIPPIVLELLHPE